MYELPTQGNIKRVVLDESTIEGQGKPLLVYGDEKEQPKTERNLRDAAA